MVSERRGIMRSHDRDGCVAPPSCAPTRIGVTGGGHEAAGRPSRICNVRKRNKGRRGSRVLGILSILGPRTP